MFKRLAVLLTVLFMIVSVVPSWSMDDNNSPPGIHFADMLAPEVPVVVPAPVRQEKQLVFRSTRQSWFMRDNFKTTARKEAGERRRHPESVHCAVCNRR